MLQLNIRYLVALRGIKHPQSYLINNGFTEGEARWLLKKDRKSVSHKMLERLCAFFDCTTDGLYDWSGAPTHVLAGLSKTQKPNFQKLLEGKTLEELEELYRKMENGEI